MKTAIDLFCGAGGFSLGLERAGWSVEAGYDNDKHCIDTYSANLAHHAHIADLSKREQIALVAYKNNPPALLAGSPPCQDFSTAGKRSLGARADLTVSFAKIVASLRSPLFVMENVLGIRGTETLGIAKDKLKEAGYFLQEGVFNAAYYGVPQNRKRYFLVGTRQPSCVWYQAMRRMASPKKMTVAEYEEAIVGDGTTHIFYSTRNTKQRNCTSIHEPSNTIRTCPSETLPDDLRFADERARMPDHFWTDGISLSKKRIYSKHDTAPTIPAQHHTKKSLPKNYTPHPNDTAPIGDVEPLTHRMRALLQTFPDDYKWIGGSTAKRYMIGNAVPPKFAEAVGKALMAEMP